MRTTESFLNPYAASYVPLSKRAAANENKDLNSTQEIKGGNEAVDFGYQSNDTLTQSQHQNVFQSQVHYASALHTAELSKWKDHHGGEFYASTSHYSKKKPEKSNFDEEFDMDLAYLQMTFPGLSHDSLSNVYIANKCDMDYTIEMLDHLESYPDDLSEKLPDTLDIGDGPESSSSVELASQKLKSMTAETGGASTSGSSNLSSAG